MDKWSSVCERLRQNMPDECYQTWFAPTHQDSITGSTVFVRVPNKQWVSWVSENFHADIEAAIRQSGLEQYGFVYLPSDAYSSTADAQSESIRGDESVLTVRLNRDYRFDTFIVGDSNRFAHAAAMAVAEQPAAAYNPFYIYGGVGLGKTHLMHSIGHYILQKKPHLRIEYISSEHFTNELISSIRYDRMLFFREKYRTIDVLLVDDIQFLSGKEKTQEKFFHTFNALYDGQRQIVISSDCPPKQIKDIEERLHSRFEWGLIADIQPPELETRVAILQKKAELQGVQIDDTIATYIASNIKLNIRELEGSLNRLLAYSSLTGESLDIALAKRVLNNITPQEQKHITIDRIKKVVCEYFRIKQSDLISKSNSRAIAEPRQIAMYLAKQLTTLSLPKIAKDLGDKHHTTVLYAIQKVAARRGTDADFRITIQRLMDLLS